MIDSLPPPPPMPAAPAKSPIPRAQTTAPFEPWLSLPRHALEPAGTTAVMASAVMDAVAVVPESLEAVFELHLRRDTGEIEVVSVLWRLAGNGSLSYLSPDPQQSTTAQLVQWHGSAGTTAGTVTTPALPPVAIRAGTTPSPMSIAASPPIVFAPGTPTLTTPRAAAEMGGTALLASVAEPWLARLLRWFEQQGHDPVVWIRDYRLDDAASQAVAHEVRTVASRQGWQLERIVVNARELWRAPNTTYLQEKPSCP